MIELVLRLVFSLAVVVGLLLMLARFSAKRFGGRPDALVRVVHRQSLSRGASVAVVTVGSRVLVLGTTEHQVQLITELDPEELEEFQLPETPENAAEGHGSPSGPSSLSSVPDAYAASQSAGALSTRADGILAGSVLSAQTWREALAAATGRDRNAS